MKSNLRRISFVLTLLILVMSLSSGPVYASGKQDTVAEVSSQENGVLSKLRAIISGSVIIDKIEDKEDLDNNIDIDSSLKEDEESIKDSVEVDKESSEGDSVLTPEESDILGSITIQLEDTEKKLPKGNVSLAVVKVADVLNGEFVMTDEYSEVGVDLNKIQNSNELEVVATKLSKVASETGTVLTNDEGQAVISNLKVGVYLIYAIDIADYENITPFLISIPTWSEADAEMIYDMEVFPKHTPLPEPKPPVKIPTGIENKSLEYGLLSMFMLVTALGIYTVSNLKEKKKYN